MFLIAAVLGCAVVLLVGILFRRAAASAYDLGVVADAVPATVEPRAQPVVCRTLRVYFIKPSKYDDAGWVQWFWKGVLPNNTLTVLAALNDTYNALHREQGIHPATPLCDDPADAPILPATIPATPETA